MANEKLVSRLLKLSLRVEVPVKTWSSFSKSVEVAKNLDTMVPLVHVLFKIMFFSNSLAAPDLTKFSAVLPFETQKTRIRMLIAKDQFKRHASLHISRSRTKKTKVSAGWFSEEQLRQKFPLPLARKGETVFNPNKISISILHM